MMLTVTDTVLLLQYTIRQKGMAKVPLNVRIDPKLMEQIKATAKRENRTVSNLVDTAIRAYVAKSKRKN